LQAQLVNAAHYFDKNNNLGYFFCLLPVSLGSLQQQHDRGNGEGAGVEMGRGSGLLMLRAVVCL